MWQRSKIFPNDFFEYPSRYRKNNVRKIKVYKVRFGLAPVFGFGPVEYSETGKGIAFSFTDPRKEKQSFIHPIINRAVKSTPEFLKEYEFWTSASNRRVEIPQHILNDVHPEDESAEDALIEERYKALISESTKKLGEV
jgi:hypothetical protein